MPDYTPVLLPGLTMTSTAVTDLIGGDPVEVAGTGAVQRCTAGPSGLGSAKFVGHAGRDTRAGYPVTVFVGKPVHDGVADEPITAGDQLMASSKPGRTVKAAPDTAASPGQADVETARVIIGLALTTAADGAAVRWMQH